MFLVDSFDPNELYSCGSLDFYFSGTFPKLVATVVLLIKIVVPILLIIFGMLDLGKAVVASKEDEIKKGQQLFIKRVVSAIIVFFVIQIVQLLIGFVATDDDNKSITSCFNCFVNGRINDRACVKTGKTSD